MTGQKEETARGNSFDTWDLDMFNRLKHPTLRTLNASCCHTPSNQGHCG